MILDRRTLLLAPLAVSATGAYAAGAEPMMLTVARYNLSPSGWPADLTLSIAAIADVHACDPWMSVAHIERIVDATNALKPDLVVLLGDYVAGHRKISATVPDRDWALALARLKAPLGVYAILGNHDWWADHEAIARGRGPIAARIALERAGVPVLENECVRCIKGGKPFWLAGLGDQEAFSRTERGGGVDDLQRTLAAVTDDAPVILLAHEPDIFPKTPRRVALTLAGHTHGGQVRVFGIAPVAPSPLSRRYLQGHFVEQERHLIVSGGLGCTWWPVRVGVPPEIVQVELGPGAPPLLPSA